MVKQYEEISLRIIEPKNKNEFLQTITRTCCHTSCPLLAKGMCLNEKIMLSEVCPNSKTTVSKFVTKRSKNYKETLAALRLKARTLSEPKQRFVNIGTHVYLNYPFMSGSLPFLFKATLFTVGSHFMAIEDFNLKTILQIVDFRPRTIIDNVEITEYRKSSVPLFLKDLSLFENELFAKLIAVRPELQKIADGLMAPIPLSFLISYKYNGKLIVASSGVEADLINDELFIKTSNPLSLDGVATTFFKPKGEIMVTVVDRNEHRFYEDKYFTSEKV